MGNKIIALLEAHIEKIVLGACALFMLWMMWSYLIGTPHTIEYGGRELKPGELYEVVKAEADRLESAIRNAEPPESEFEPFAARLRQGQQTSILAPPDGAASATTPELRVTSTFGSRIAVPGLEEEEEEPGSIRLVTPLRPTKPVVEVGRSMAYRTPLQIGEPATLDDEIPEPQETPWVTIAAYFDKAAQYKEMIQAGYAPFRSRVYIVGTEVQRQERLADGSWSPWETVQSSAAMPKLSVPDPVIDESDGSLLNKEELDEAFHTVKEFQQVLEQPPFYLVDAGDRWRTPPLEGYDKPEADTEDEAEDSSRFANAGPEGGLRGRGTGLTPSGPRSSGSGARGNPRGSSGGRTGRSPRGGGPEGASPGRAPVSRVDEGRSARQMIRRQLDDARQAFASENYAQARDIAGRVLNDAEANAGDKKDAQRIITACEQRIEREMIRQQIQSGGIDRLAMVGEPIVHPDKRQTVAVWFHDDTVESGKTYRYRMRVKLWNRYVGQIRPMADPAEARQPVVAGEWSLESDPVTVTPSTYFFVRGASLDGDTASLDVWKWRKGSWIKQTFEAAIGDQIGEPREVRTGEFDEKAQPVRATVDFSTGAIVLDLRVDDPVQQRIAGKDGFSYRDQETVTVVYLDPADGQVKEKSMLADRYDPMRKKLEEQEL
ncbi:MAG: hypothetical protein D6744_10925 [Planctomycetota bacterium]|nr:MAG: hypothetical protein D6744_10925 [Planctomycetota bacterium]